MAFVTPGCRPARVGPGIQGISGSGRVRLVSEHGFVQSILRIILNSRSVSVMTLFGCHDFWICCLSAQLCKSLSV
ncbi:hypothetical protein C1H46_012767 [Malus baccata]|uniref:Uncharacterized protein n=1 Tax=Malus baccata TaxID=106549 RepID=A0A540MS76_MALBA|nr:hypothetical protein C1H46_012767 [Malus baccata]